MVSHEDITRALEQRFDYYSARYILREALKSATLSEKPSYDEQEVAALATALSGMETRVEGVVARLRSLSAGAPAAPAPEPAAPAVEPAAPVADAAAPEGAEVSEEAVPEEAVPDEAVASEHEDPAEGEDADAKGRKGRRKK